MKRQRTRAGLILAASAWTFYVWLTRVWNLLQDPATSTGFKAVHVIVAVISLAFATVLAVVGVRMLRETRAAGSSTRSSTRSSTESSTESSEVAAGR